MRIYKILFLMILGLVAMSAILPLTASAQSEFHLVPCGRSFYQPPAPWQPGQPYNEQLYPDAQCQFRHLVILITRLINYLITVAAIVAMYQVLLAAWNLITSVGNAEKIEKAKKGISNAIVGFGLIVFAFVAVNLLVNGLFGKGGTPEREWWRLECIYDPGKAGCPFNPSNPINNSLSSANPAPSPTPSPSSPQAVANAAISPGGGTFSSPQSVSLTTATAGAEIRYTLDGTDPTSSSALYSGPITISTTTTLKARAFKSGMADSQISAATFTISSASAQGPAPANLSISPTNAFAGKKTGTGHVWAE